MTPQNNYDDNYDTQRIDGINFTSLLLTCAVELIRSDKILHSMSISFLLCTIYYYNIVFLAVKAEKAPSFLLLFGVSVKLLSISEMQ